MKRALLAIAAGLLGVPAVAQDNAGHTMPAPAPTGTPAAARLSLDTPLATLMADARAKAVIDAALPGVSAHPAYEQFKGMSLNQLAPMASDQLPAAKLAQIKTGLDAIR